LSNQELQVSQKLYGIECELGSLEITIYEPLDSNGFIMLNKANEFFPCLQPRERFRSMRYKELEYDFISTDSCRRTAQRLNRIRLENSKAKATTVRNQAEREGEKINHAKALKSMDVFSTCGFDYDGYKNADTEIDFSIAKTKIADAALVEKESAEIGVSADNNDYENGTESINISIDEVGCKKQTEQRPHVEKKNEPKQVRNTVIHIQKGKQNYILNAESISESLSLLMGFLLSNDLLGKYPITFFADGASTIKDAIADFFWFAPYKLILDWPHLPKKLSELLSMSINSTIKRNEILDQMKLFLWKGDVDSAINVIDNIETKWIKSAKWLGKIVPYLKKRKDSIPCYALRASLGLRNSSNLGEKSNDRVVSSRQKHNGMAWSDEGSAGLATICATQINNEMPEWLLTNTIRFGFAEDGVIGNAA